MSFYSQVMGWGFEEHPSRDFDQPRIVWAQISSGLCAGMQGPRESSLDEDLSASWHVFLAVEDSDAIAQKSSELGGGVSMEPFEVEGGITKVGAITDLDGTTIGIIQHNRDVAAAKAEPGAMQWCELLTPNGQALTDFFAELLDVGIEPIEMPDGSTYSVIMSGGERVAGIGAMPTTLTDRGIGTSWVVYFNVVNVDTTVERALALGAELPDPPWEATGIGRIAWLFDPQGALFAVMTPDEASY